MNYRSLIGANASLLSGLASQDASPPNQTINTYSNPSNIKRFDSLVNSIASAGAQFEVPNSPSHHRRNHRKIINPNGLKPRVHRNINGITDTDSNNDIFIDPSGVRPRNFHRNINGITDTDPNNDIYIDPSGVRPRYHRNINGISNGSRFIDPSGVKPRIHRNINGITDTDTNNDIFIDPSGVRHRNFHRNINGITDIDPTNDMFIDPSGVKPRYHRNINGITDIDPTNDIFIDPSGVRPRDFNRNINGITDNVYYDDEADSYTYDVDSYSDDYEEPIVDPTIPDAPTPDPEPEPATDPEPTPENNGQFIPLPPVYRKPSISVYTIVIIIIVILLLVLIFKIANEQKQLTRVINRATNY